MLFSSNGILLLPPLIAPHFRDVFHSADTVNFSVLEIHSDSFSLVIIYIGSLLPRRAHFFNAKAFKTHLSVCDNGVLE